MDNFNNQKMIDANSVFAKRFLNSKSLYLYHFNRLPSMHFISDINGEKAYNAFIEMFSDQISSEHQYRWYQRKKKKYHFDETIFIMKNHCLVELHNYCEILHDGTQHDFIEQCTALMNRFKERNKQQPQEIELIIDGGCGMELKSMEIKK